MKKLILSAAFGFAVAFVVGFTSGSAEASASAPAPYGTGNCTTDADCVGKCPPEAEGAICSRTTRTCLCYY
jgi:hypothetical protein